MPAFRFLTAGESHGPALGATIEGVPAGLPLTEDDLAVDLARRQRGYGRGARQAIEQDRAQILGGVRHGRTLGLADPAARPQPRLGELDAGDAGRAADRGRGRRAARGRRRGQQASHPGHTRPARPRGPGRRPQVRIQRRPRRPRARVRARDRRSRRGRWCRARLPARAGHRGLVVQRRGRWRGGRSGELHAFARRGRRVAAAMPGPRRGDADDRANRRGAVGRRHGRRRLRGRGPRAAHRPRLVRPLGPPARRRPRRRGDEHQHRQGRRIRARLRADAPLRLGRPRRHRGQGRRRPLGPPDEQRRRADRRRDQRRAAGCPRRREADLDARPAAAVGRPRDGRGGRQGALRAQRHQRRARGRRRGRGDGHAHAGRGRHRQVRRRHAR